MKQLFYLGVLIFGFAALLVVYVVMYIIASLLSPLFL